MQMLFGSTCDCDPDKDMDCGLTACCGGSNLGIVRTSAIVPRRFELPEEKPKAEGYRPPPWVRGKKR